MRTYYEISTGFVKDLPLGRMKVETAHRAAASFLAVMQMPWIRMRWFLPEDQLPLGAEVLSKFTRSSWDDDADLLGLFRPAECFSILLNAAADTEKIAETTIHELTHVYQYFFQTTNGFRTAEIDEFNADMVAAHFHKRGIWRNDDTTYWAYLAGRGFDAERKKEAEVLKAKWAEFRKAPAKPKETGKAL